MYYAQQITDLEQSLAEQRLAIQASYAQQAKAQQNSAEQTASGVITNPTSYIQSLQNGSASPLSPQSQYALAKSQYQAVAGAAAAGDVTSLDEVQSYASAFQSASQNVNGSGQSYAADFNTVLQNLSAIAAIPQNTLTASFMQAALTDQTTPLTAVLNSLCSDVQGVKMEIQQQNARAAA